MATRPRGGGPGRRAKAATLGVLALALVVVVAGLAVAILGPQRVGDLVEGARRQLAARARRPIAGLSAPGALAVGPVAPAESSLELRWTDTSTSEAGFAIERKTGTAAFAEVARVPANVTGYVDTGLLPGTAYSYRVRAGNAQGASPYSNVATATTAAAPPAATPMLVLPTASATPTAAPPAATATAVPPTATAIPSPTPTPRPTATASPTITVTPTATPPSATATPAASPSPTTAPTGGSATSWNQQTYGGALFSPTSAWNAKASGAVDPNSSTMLTHLTLSSTPFDVMMTSSGIALYYADAATPKVMVSASTTWWPGVQAPVPPEAKPDTGSDHHLVVWDVPNHTLYEFWNAVKSSSGAWSAGYGITFDSAGIGYQTGLWQGSARESGVSLAGGLIRYSEMKDGVIPHALAMSYPYTRGDGYARGLGSGGVMGIASQANTGTAAKGYVGWGYLPEGGRVRLKASVDVNARCGANRACQVIGTALQQYGAYVVDTGGWPAFYAEILDGKQVSWSGLLSATDTNLWQAADFEVLALPTLTALP